MYLNYFGLAERPFSIAPDPQYLYMSARHREAMAHLSYGLSQGGCFIVLTGEVGTGKTTLCRNLLADLPDNVDVALVLNPKINRRELLETVCDELKIQYPEQYSKKKLLDSINEHLLKAYADNRHTVLIIDEAQLLSHTVLEQVRLLTNLETTKSKLLQIILIGQPELSDVLMRNDLRQLAQRVTARYHLPAIGCDEIQDYVNFRLGVAGCRKPLFSGQSLKLLHQLSEGIPRKINVLADHALLATYAKSQLLVDSKTVKQSAKDVLVKADSSPGMMSIRLKFSWFAAIVTMIVLNVGLWWWFTGNGRPSDIVEQSEPVQEQAVLNTSVDRDNTVVNNGDSERSRFTGQAADRDRSGILDADKSTQKGIDLSALSQAGGVLSATVKPEGVAPGSVVISQEYLDDSVESDNEVGLISESGLAIEPPALDFIAAKKSEPPAYLANSAFGRVLDVSSDRTGRVEAFRNLATAWDVNLPKSLLGPLCGELGEKGVACLPVSDWNSILRLNRPTIMVLTHENARHRIILYKLNNGIASVLVGDQSYELSVDELQDRWSDNAIVFWRPADMGSKFLQLGDESPAVSGLRVKLNKIFVDLSMPRLSRNDSTIFDVELATKVSQLQRRFGILSDGKIGRETYLLINELLNSGNVPMLVERREGM